jgi:hypothetical protein
MIGLRIVKCSVNVERVPDVVHVSIIWYFISSIDELDAALIQLCQLWLGAGSVLHSVYLGVPCVCAKTAFHVHHLIRIFAVPTVMQAEGGLGSFNAYFTKVKKGHTKYMADHEGKSPCPDQCRVVLAAAGGDVADLQGLSAEDAYDMVDEYLPNGAQVRMRVMHGRQLAFGGRPCAAGSAALCMLTSSLVCMVCGDGLADNACRVAST